MNKRLILGMTIIFLFFLVALFGPLVAPYDVNYSEKIMTIQTEEGMEWVFAPVPPEPRHWFGTNEWGYDILTLVIYGAKYTFFMAVGVSLARVLVGGAMGLILGIKMNKHIGSFNLSVLNGIPAFLMVWLIMINININSPIPSWKLALIQGFIMTIIGIPGIVAVIQNKTMEIRKEEFVLAAHALGATDFRIITKHILPLLKESIVILLVNEVIVVLSLIGQLGIFNLFLGGTILTFDPPLYQSVTHEWAGLIGQARNHLRSDTWILVYPLVSYLLMLIGFYSLSRGLESRFQKIYSRTPHV